MANPNQTQMITVDPDGPKKDRTQTDTLNGFGITVGNIHVQFSATSVVTTHYDPAAFVRMAEIAAGLKKFWARITSWSPGHPGQGGGGTP